MNLCVFTKKYSVVLHLFFFTPSYIYNLWYYLQIPILTRMICSHRNVEFIKSEFNSFQILFILHSIYEITTNDIGLIGKWIIGTEYCAFTFLGAKNFLITLSSTDVFRIWLNKICKKKFKWNLNCDWVIY